MMTRTTSLVWAVAAVLVCGVALTAPAQDHRLAFVDLDYIFNEFYKTGLADERLREQADEFNEERRRMVGEYEALQEAFSQAREDAQNAALSEDVRSRRRAEAEDMLVDIRDFENRIQRFDQSRRKQLEDQGRRMRSRLVEEIQEVIRTYARNEGYHVVIDSSGQSLNAVEIVLYVDARIDISDAIISILNKDQ